MLLKLLWFEIFFQKYQLGHQECHLLQFSKADFCALIHFPSPFTKNPSEVSAKKINGIHAKFLLLHLLGEGQLANSFHHSAVFIPGKCQITNVREKELLMGKAILHVAQAEK